MARAVKIAVVTGAAGFVGAELTKQLLERGYTVRATVRKANPESTGFLEKLAAALPGKLEIIEGADLSVDGSFDKAVNGATYVFHVASPVSFGTGNPEEDQKSVVDPAIKGTLTVLGSVAKSLTVKRVVLTSSIVSLHQPTQPLPEGKVLGPKDWNTFASMEKGASYAPYSVSKVQAEKAAWKFAKEHNINLVTILPSIIIGPVLSTRGGFSVNQVQVLLEGAKFSTLLGPRFCDVRDVAKVHVLAAETPSANGRYIVSNANTTSYKDLSDALEEEFPDIAFTPSEHTPVRPIFDISKVEKELGLKLTPPTTSFKDQARTLLALGYGNPAFKK